MPFSIKVFSRKLTTGRQALILPFLAFSLFSSSCSAKEVTATAEEKPAAVAETVQAKVEQLPQVAIQKGEVDARYAALFDKAKEVIALGLENNPDNFVAGTNYDVLEPRQPITGTADKIEVAEFFSYGCGHCFNSEPYMHAYAGQVAEDVNFVRIPASFNPPFELLARGYYSAQALGADDEAHIAIFDAIHIKRRQELMKSESALAEFYSAYGVDKDQFMKSLNSFSINSLIERDRKLAQGYKITGVPAVVVNGAYNTGGSKAGTLSSWFQILDVLTEKERTARAASSE